MRKMVSALAFWLLAAPVWAAPQNWADDNKDYAQGTEFQASKAVCTRLKNLSPPEADKPSALEAEHMKGCKSEKLYYGIGIEPDFVRARQCAFLEQAEEPGDELMLFSGSAILMTIYANGKGGSRDLDLATSLACQMQDAPAAMKLRIEHLQNLRTAQGDGQEKEFHVCNDVSSGSAMSWCGSHVASIADVERSRKFAHVQSKWTDFHRQAFEPLQRSFEIYAIVSRDHEIVTMGTLAGLLMVGRESQLRDQFLSMIEALENDSAPPGTKATFEKADAELNAIYRRIMGGKRRFGEPSKEDIRTAQRAWLRYRDAWASFAAGKYPGISPERLKTWLTNQRNEDLRELHR